MRRSVVVLALILCVAIVAVQRGNACTSRRYPVLIPGASPGPIDYDRSVVADFNNDGKLDFILFGWVMFGNGDGTFGNAKAAPLTPLGAADFNGDGKVDLVGLPAGSNSQLSIAFGNGDGTFQPPVTIPIPGVAALFAADVTVADVNGDGRPDLYVRVTSGSGTTPQYTAGILINNGDGTFGSFTSYGDGTLPFPVLVDVNGDGKPDLVLNDRSILLNQGNGTFQKTTAQVPVVSTTNNVASIADADGDGIPDVIASGFLNGAPGLLIYYGQGNLTFASPILAVPFDYNYFVPQITVADFDADGKPDIVFSLEKSGPFPMQWVRGAGRSYGPMTPLPVSDSNFWLANFTPDKLPDVLGLYTYKGRAADVVVNDPQRCVSLQTTSSNPNPVAGETVTLTTHVTPADSGGGTPSGGLTYVSHGTNSGRWSAPLVNGTATLNVSADQLTNNGGTLDIVYSGDSVFDAENINQISQNGSSPGDFSISPAQTPGPSLTVVAGQSATFTMVAQPTYSPNGSFYGVVSLSCSGAPANASCALPATFQVGAGSSSFNVSVVTTSRTAAAAVMPQPFSAAGWILTIAMMALGSLWFASQRKKLASHLGRHGKLLLLLLCAIVGVASQVGCGGSFATKTVQQGTPAGTYTLAVTATYGSVKHTQNLTLTVQ